MTITATSWSAAEAKFTQNLSGSTSVAAGFMGSDAGYTIDLGSTRVLWVFGDTFWATAAGKTRAQCSFIRNCVALQTVSYDLSASTMTWYTGGSAGSPLPFFNWRADSSGTPRWFWPNSGILLDDKLLIMLSAFVPYPEGPVGFQFKYQGTQAVLCDLLSGTPDTWTQMYVPTPTQRDNGIHFGLSMIDNGDGYVYCWGSGSGNKWYLARWDRSKAKSGDLMDPDWWTDIGWSKRYPSQVGLKSYPRINNNYQLVADVNQNNGTVNKRSDTKWQQLMIPQYPGTTFAYSQMNSGPDATFPAVTNFYNLPEAGDNTIVCYAGLGHPEQTFSGKASDDIVVTYATNAAGSGNVYTDMDTYFHRVVKVTGI